MRSPHRSPPDKAHDDAAKRLAQKLRPTETEILDVCSAEFLGEARRQSRLVASAEEEDEIQAFIERVTDWQSR